MDENNAKEQDVVRRLTPWWASVLMAIVCYCAFKYLIPALHPENGTLLKISEAAPTFAPLVAIPFLLLAAKRLYDSAPDDGHNQNSNPDDEHIQGE